MLINYCSPFVNAPIQRTEQSELIDQILANPWMKDLDTFEVRKCFGPDFQFTYSVYGTCPQGDDEWIIDVPEKVSADILAMALAAEARRRFRKPIEPAGPILC